MEADVLEACGEDRGWTHFLEERVVKALGTRAHLRWVLLNVKGGQAPQQCRRLWWNVRPKQGLVLSPRGTGT